MRRRFTFSLGLLRIAQVCTLHVLLLLTIVSIDAQPTRTNSSRTTSNQTATTPTNKTQGVDVNLLFSTPEGRRGLDDMQLAPLIAACVAVFFGAVLCFAGARVLRYAALGCAFFDGAFATAAVLERVLRDAEYEGVASWTFFFLGGIFCCLLVVSIEQLDVFCVGLTAGMMLAFLSLTTFGYHIAPNHPEIVLCVMLGVLGPGTGLLSLKLQPVSVLPATSWIGSNMATWGIGYFFGEYPNGTSLRKFRRPSDGKYEIPRAWWGYLAGVLVCFVMGTCVQMQTYRFKRKRITATTMAAAVVSPERGDYYNNNCDDELHDVTRYYYSSIHTPPASEQRRQPTRPQARAAIV